MFIDDNMKVSEIAEKFGVSGGLIEIRLREAGIRRDTPHNLLPISDEQIDELYLRQRLTIKEVAAQLGISVSGLRKRLVNRDINRYRKMFQIDADQLRKDYHADGLSLAQIGEKYSVDAVTILNKMRKYGIERHEMPRGTALDVEILRQLYVEDKLTMSQIGARLGCSKQSVRRQLNVAGLLLTNEEKAERREERGNKSAHVSGSYNRIKAPGHPAANADGYVVEHRLVMESAIGRYLKPEEEVHHVNMKKLDNRIENLLMIGSSRDHHRLHKYMERCAAYLLRGGDKPEPVQFEAEAFFERRWINQLDLMGERKPTFSDLFAAAVNAAPKGTKEFVN